MRRRAIILAMIAGLIFGWTLAVRLGASSAPIPHSRVCVLARTADDIGWRDQYGKTHDYMPLCGNGG